MFKSEYNAQWTNLFDRIGRSGWLGADGIYTVALDGCDAMGSAKEGTETFFIFSDTILGSSHEDGAIDFAAMPNHTAALFSGNTPESENIDFYFGHRANMKPDGSNLFGEPDWMLDTFVVGDKLCVFGFPQEGWKPVRMDLVTVPITEEGPDFSAYTITTGIKELLCRQNDDFIWCYGVGVMPNTEQSGAKDPDGYIYLYGYRDDMQKGSQKDLIVSRIHETDFPDFTKLEYYEEDGSWGQDITKSKVILDRVSCEFSVTPVPKGPAAGKYIAVYTQDTQSERLCYAIGDSPVGPFSEGVVFYTCPETGNLPMGGTGTYYTYNAKAHPHLSADGKLLVSYNVNVGGAPMATHTADYRPRFVTLDLEFEKEEEKKTKKISLLPIAVGALVVGAAALILGKKKK